MKFFTIPWYEEMQVRGFMVFPETEQDWLEDVAWHVAEGISYEERAKDFLEYMKADLLKYLPEYFHSSIYDGTINSTYPAPEFKEQALQWGRNYDERLQENFREYRQGFEAIKDLLPAPALQLVEKNLHDSRVISYVVPEDGVMEMTLDCSGAMHYQCDIRLRFTGVTGLMLPEQLEKKYWLYDEIYAVEQGFELRVLMDSPPSELRITAQDISIELLGEPNY
ncbi:DUF4085 family protein [Paenibacillus tritici]|uniref:DUF4085 family protein n=1 Tax=Paenibacillus tritici TaxID=1873425 RepID=A0ABX2DH16_9BACL|nr:DUF4085 family protein [Paenibacillus tritici]NQX43765.1 DUF4085 family protein [Paenibacillus tritici]